MQKDNDKKNNEREILQIQMKESLLDIEKNI